MGAHPKAIASAWKAALRAIYPPQCPACGMPVAQEGGLCPSCWADASFITGTACARCGVPLPDDGIRLAGNHGLLCDECLAIERPWQRGVAALRYSGTGRRLVLALKHGDRPDLAVPLAGWLADALGGLAKSGPVVVPIPIHPRRLMKRRYNQAALIATSLARRLGLVCRPCALKRRHHTPMQEHRSLADRFRNQQAAIGVAPREMPRLIGRPILLVDDVMASGATLAAAATALQQAGAGPISIAVVARALKDD